MDGICDTCSGALDAWGSEDHRGNRTVTWATEWLEHGVSRSYCLRCWQQKLAERGEVFSGTAVPSETLEMEAGE